MKVHDFTKGMMNEDEIIDLGHMRYFLGIQVQQSKVWNIQKMCK